MDGKNKLRHAVEHCQITDRALLERIAKDDILVFAQPIFLDYDMNIVEKLCGKELASTSYAFGTLLRLSLIHIYHVGQLAQVTQQHQAE